MWIHAKYCSIAWQNDGNLIRCWKIVMTTILAWYDAEPYISITIIRILIENFVRVPENSQPFRIASEKHRRTDRGHSLSRGRVAVKDLYEPVVHRAKSNSLLSRIKEEKRKGRTKEDSSTLCTCSSLSLCLRFIWPCRRRDRELY